MKLEKAGLVITGKSGLRGLKRGGGRILRRGRDPRKRPFYTGATILDQKTGETRTNFIIVYFLEIIQRYS